MLVLTRKQNESIMLGEDVKITVLDISGETVKIGIEAPKEMVILRSELYLAVKGENTQAVEIDQSVLEQFNKLIKGGRL